MPGFPKSSRPQQRDQSRGLAQKVQLQGAQRIQELIRQNQQLPAADRAALVESEKAKGNDFFRSGQMQEAVECYTLCIGLEPTQLAAYTNRAQAHLRMKKWDDAISDCNSALSCLQQQEAAGGSPELTNLRVKALVRRGKAFGGKKQHVEALKDFEAALLLVPGNEELEGLAAQARKVLAQQAAPAAATAAAAAVPKPAGRRIPVVEVLQEEEGQVEGDNDRNTPIAAAGSPAGQLGGKQQPSQQQSRPQQQQQQQASSPSPLSPSSANGKQPVKRIAIDVVEVDDSDDDSSTAGDNEQQQQHDVPSGGDIQQQQQQQQQRQQQQQQSPSGQQQPQQPPQPELELSTALQTAQGAIVDNNNSSSGATGGSISGDEASDGSASGSVSDEGLGGGDDAAAAAEDVEPVQPEYEEALEGFCKNAKAAFEQGDYAQALNMYNIALQHAPDSTRVLVNASLTLLKLAKPRAAHEKATLAVGLQPRNAKAYHARHKAKEVLGDFKGAIADLNTVITLEPPGRNLAYAQELAALENRAHVATLQTQSAAEQQRHDTRTVSESCTIEEVGDEPEEAQQKLHDELKSHERVLLRRAAKLRERAGAARAEYDAKRAVKLEEAQQRQQRALHMQQERQQRQQRRQAHAQKQSQAWQGKGEGEQQGATSAAPEPASLAVTPPAEAAAEPVPAEPPAAAGSGAVRADVPASPLQQAEHAQAAADASPNIDDYASAAAAGADSAATAAPAVAPVEVPTGPSTPRDGPEPAPTPHSTPAGPIFVFESPGLSPGASKKQQQQRSKGASPTMRRQQQQQAWQQPQQIQLTAAAVEANIAKQVQEQRELGNKLLSEGDLAGAEEAYKEALSMDPDNVKVLLNLAMLALRKQDGELALRCCDEVLAQEGCAPDLSPALVQKARLRRGLALELLGQYEDALQLLSVVKEQSGATADPQLAADMLRLALLVQQKQAEAAAALNPPTPAATAPSGTTATNRQAAAVMESNGSAHDGSSSSSSSVDMETVTDEDALQQEQEQQQQQHGPEAGDRDLPFSQVLSEGQHPASRVSSTGVGRVDGLPAVGQGRVGGKVQAVKDPLKEDSQHSTLPDSSFDSLLRSSTTLQRLQPASVKQTQKQPVTSVKPPQQQQQQQQQQQRPIKQQPSKQKPQPQDPTATAALLQKIQDMLAQKQKRSQQEQLEASPDREKGNAAWKAGNLQAALKHYTAALAADPTDVRAYSNRAQVYLKLKRPAKVEEDCSLALGLLQQQQQQQQQQGGVGAGAASGDLYGKAAEQLHSKVLYRRALARRDQGKVKEAFADLKALRESNTESDPAVEKLYAEIGEAYRQQIQRLVQAQQQQLVPDANEASDPAAAAAAAAKAAGMAAAAAAASDPAVRLHRIHIDETDGSESDEEIAAAAAAAAAYGGDVGESDDEGQVMISVQPAAAVK